VPIRTWPLKFRGKNLSSSMSPACGLRFPAVVSLLDEKRWVLRVSAVSVEWERVQWCGESEITVGINAKSTMGPARRPKNSPRPASSTRPHPPAFIRPPDRLSLYLRITKRHRTVPFHHIINL
jgi:hypothetical protein